MSSNVCIFCGLSFEEDSLFWDHMVSGSCSQTNESAQSSVAPRPLTDNKSISSISGTFAATSESSIGSSSSQSRVNGNTYNWDNKTPPPENKLISNPVQPPSPPHAPPDSTLLPLGSTKVNGATVNSLANGGFPNFPVGGTQCNRAPPQACTSKQSPPPHAPLSMPTMCSTSTSLECTPVTSTRANGFTRRTEDSPGSLAGASVSASSQSKWKCVLCSLEFVDRIPNTLRIQPHRTNTHVINENHLRECNGEELSKLLQIPLFNSTTNWVLYALSLIELTICVCFTN